MAKQYRFSIALVIVLAAVVTLLLFVLMQGLITLGVDDMSRQPRQQVADFLMPDHELMLIEKQHKPDKPKPPETPPPELTVQLMELDSPPAKPLSFAPLTTSLGVQLKGIGIGVGDGEYLPLVRPPPIYPRYAQSRGIEGYVIIEFTVTQAGTVINPRIIEGDPLGVFDNAALRAVKGYKYKPKMVDGTAVDVTGVRQKFTFKLDQ